MKTAMESLFNRRIARSQISFIVILCVLLATVGLYSKTNISPAQRQTRAKTSSEELYGPAVSIKDAVLAATAVELSYFDGAVQKSPLASDTLCPMTVAVAADLAGMLQRTKVFSQEALPKDAKFDFVVIVQSPAQKKPLGIPAIFEYSSATGILHDCNYPSNWCIAPDDFRKSIIGEKAKLLRSTSLVDWRLSPDGKIVQSVIASIKKQQDKKR